MKVSHTKLFSTMQSRWQSKYPCKTHWVTLTSIGGNNTDDQVQSVIVYDSLGGTTQSIWVKKAAAILLKVNKKRQFHLVTKTNILPQGFSNLCIFMELYLLLGKRFTARSACTAWEWEFTTRPKWWSPMVKPNTNAIGMLADDSELRRDLVPPPTYVFFKEINSN